MNNRKSIDSLYAELAVTIVAIMSHAACPAVIELSNITVKDCKTPSTEQQVATGSFVGFLSVLPDQKPVPERRQKAARSQARQLD